MCAIIDANVVHETLGTSGTEAGLNFLKWVNRGSRRLVVGGYLLEELGRVGYFKRWLATAAQFGKVQFVDSKAVAVATAKLQESGDCESDDEHVIALAQVSGARLLFTNEPALQADFKARELLNEPRGRIYTTRLNKSYTQTHKRLLGNRSLCRTNTQQRPAN